MPVSFHFRRRRRAALWLARALLALVVVARCDRAHADGTVTPEARVKAAFVFNFAKFVEWPATAFHGPSAPFVIGLLGDDALGAAIDELTAGESVAGHPLSTRRVTAPDACLDCQIVVVGAGEAGRIDAVLAAYRGRPILTVSEIPNFAERGGGMALVKEDSRVRVQINAQTNAAAGLTVSSKLMAIARVVGAASTP